MKSRKVIIVALVISCSVMGLILMVNATVQTESEFRINVVERTTMEEVREYLDLSTMRYLLTEFSNGGGVNYAMFKIDNLDLVDDLLGMSMVLSNGTGKIFYNLGSGIFFIFAYEIAGELEFYMTHTPLDATNFDLETVLNDIIEVAA